MSQIILFFATGFGAGYSPLASGTVGSLVALPLIWFLKDLAPLPFLITLLTLTFLSVWISTFAEAIFQQKDSGKIVIDEIVGMLFSLAFIPWSGTTVLTGFLLFRLFDVWKPFPARLCQDKLPSGWGIVMDDVVAGIYANLVLHILIWFL